MTESPIKKIDWLLLPLVGVGCVLVAWAISSSTWAKELPSPLKTWQASKPYILEPFAKRGEMDQGILRFTWYSLVLVAKGYALALIIGTPIGFFLGLSKTFSKTFDPIIQVLRPISPLAWLPLGLVLFLSAGRQASELGALFTIAICAMWPTVLNTAVGVHVPSQMSFAQPVRSTATASARRTRTSLNGGWLKSIAIERVELDGEILTISAERVGSFSTDDLSEMETSAEIALSCL